MSKIDDERISVDGDPDMNMTENQDRPNPWESIFTTGVPEDLSQPFDYFEIVLGKFLSSNVTTVLDVAMGAGRHALRLAEKGYQVSGFDLSPTGTRLCQESFLKNGLSGDFCVADMFKTFPYKNDSFDAVIAIQAIYHGYKEDMRQAIEEVHRVLKQGGRFFFNVSTDKDRPMRGSDSGSATRKVQENTFIPLVGRERGLVHFYPSSEAIIEMLEEMFTEIIIKRDKINNYIHVSCIKDKERI